jgi:hypothetical protein
LGRARTGVLKAHQKDQNQRYLSLTGLVFRLGWINATVMTKDRRRGFPFPDLINIAGVVFEPFEKPWQLSACSYPELRQ